MSILFIYLKRVIFTILCLFAVGSLFSQQQAQNSLYYFNPLNYNPAYAGTRDALSFTALQRIQWTGIEGAPNTTFLTIHAPVGGKQLSWGADLTYDEIGITKTTSAYLNLSYYVQVNDRGDRLSFGLKGGINHFDAPLSQLQSNDPDDPLQEDVNNKIRGNFGAGIYFYGERHFMGFSALSLLENSIIDNDEIKALEQVRHFYLVAGYVFDVSSVMKLKPTGLIKAVPGAPTEIDLELATLLYDRLWVGMGYRFDESPESLRGYVSAYVTPQLRIGYNYDYVLSDLSDYAGGTHEFMLGYDFGNSKMSFKSPRYF